MESVKVYRNGTVESGTHSEYIKTAWSVYDLVKPEGRSGRLDSIYASPSLTGVICWVESGHMTHSQNPDADLTTYEINVADSENVYVYSIDLYDKTFGAGKNITEADAKAYWESGIPLSDWAKVSSERCLDASDWEVLIPKTKINSFLPVKNSLLVSAAPDSEAMKAVLRKRQEFLQWMTLVS